MALFFKKKAKEMPKKPAKLPSLPEFPEVRGEEFKMPKFPTYEPSIDEIKEEVERPAAELGIPERKAPREEKVMAVERERPAFEAGYEERPLFIKIERYKDALRDLDRLKEKVSEAEHILGELDSVRAEEDRRLETWKSDLKAIKDRLLSIDKHLFEV